MGLSVSASVVILFTAVVISSITLYSTIENAVDQMRDAQRFEREKEKKNIHSEIEILSVEKVGEMRTKITLKNTGRCQLEIRHGERTYFEILVNGYLFTEKVVLWSVVVENRTGTSVFNPTEEMSFELENYEPSSGDVIKIIFYEKCMDYFIYK